MSAEKSEDDAGQAAKKGIALICIGMAGAGKTSFVQKLTSQLHTAGTPPYIVNLDAAVTNIPYEPNIDIRDTVNYKEVMRQYELGPNGGIVTALNLFATKFDQVMGILEQRTLEHDHLVIDTPGQIEVFTWSASGQIITETMANTMPTVLVYIIDTPRCMNASTFLSNMLYACSILYKSKLPFILAFNKIDIVSHDFAIEWMTDYDALYEAISQDTSYKSSLSSSMATVLEEFYKNLRAVGVSALTGAGMDDFFKAVDEAAVEYATEYKPLLDRLRKEKEEKMAKNSMEKLQKDMRPEGKVVGGKADAEKLIVNGDLPEEEDIGPDDYS
eukprot:m.101298 g.101298  ORF g.101298 m.101298 type:complete len:329 (+) comp13739_c0_seq1:178-1164(+)